MNPDGETPLEHKASCPLGNTMTEEIRQKVFIASGGKPMAERTSWYHCDCGLLTPRKVEIVRLPEPFS